MFLEQHLVYIPTSLYYRCQSPKYENGFKHLMHLAHTLNWVFREGGGALTAIFRGGARGGACYFFSSMRWKWNILCFLGNFRGGAAGSFKDTFWVAGGVRAPHQFNVWSDDTFISTTYFYSSARNNSNFRLHSETAPKISTSQGSYFDHDLDDHDSNHSSEIRGLCLMTWPGKTLQNLPYFI